MQIPAEPQRHLGGFRLPPFTTHSLPTRCVLCAGGATGAPSLPSRADFSQFQASTLKP